MFQLFERIGNVKANAFWNHRKVLYSPQDKCNSLDNFAPSEQLKDYISKKYKEKSFCDTQYISEDKDSLNQVRFYRFSKIIV